MIMKKKEVYINAKIDDDRESEMQSTLHTRQILTIFFHLSLHVK